MLLDLRFAARALARRPGFLLVAVLTLGIGIGANATIFSVVRGVLLEPLPYRHPERLAILWHEFGEGAQFLPALHPLDYRDYAERSRRLEELTIATGREMILGGRDDPELADVGLVAANFFPFLGVEPALGRHFAPEEDVPEGRRVVLLGHELWQRRFGGHRGVLGRRIDVDGEPHEVVGVLPRGFRLLLPAETFRLKHSDLWRPARIDYADQPPRNYTGYTVFGRLATGASLAEARQELSGIAAELRREHPVHAASNLRVSLVPFQHDVVKGARRGLLLLLAAVGFVLLIACANVAQLLLTRGRGRERELLVRAAVGASGWRMARLVLAESLVLAAAGAVLGVLSAFAGLGLVRLLAGASVPRLGEIGIDAGVLVFVTALSALSALLFGLVPALQAARVDPALGLKEGSVGTASPRQNRVRDLLVVGQVALSLVLVVGAGLMARSFAALADVKPGFEPNGVLSLTVSLPRKDYPERDAPLGVYRELERRVGGLPGVRNVAAVTLLPLTGSGPLQPYAYDEKTARNWESVSADHRWMSPGFPEAIGATLIAGRDFSWDDYRDGRRRILIDDTLAARAFPDGRAVGRLLQVEPEGDEKSFAEVIGVLGHLKLHDLTRPLLPQIWSPGVSHRFSLVVRSEGAPQALGRNQAVPEALASAVRREIEAVNAGIAIEDVQPLQALVTEAMGSMRLAVTLLSAFGAIAVGLAAVGIYGVLSYSVGQRSREIAIRMALGDAPAGIRRLVLGHGLRVVGASLVLGIAGAGLLSRFLAALLYGVDPLDPPTYFGATLFLAAVGLLACWVPAERAARVEPLTALRQE